MGYKTGEQIRLPELLEHFTSSFILKSPGVFGDWPRDLVMSRRGLATERRRDEAKLGYFFLAWASQGFGAYKKDHWTFASCSICRRQRRGEIGCASKLLEFDR